MQIGGCCLHSGQALLQLLRLPSKGLLFRCLPLQHPPPSQIVLQCACVCGGRGPDIAELALDLCLRHTQPSPGEGDALFVTQSR